MDDNKQDWTMAALEFWYRMMEHNPETSLAGNNYDIHRPEDWQVAPHTLTWEYESYESLPHLPLGETRETLTCDSMCNKGNTNFKAIKEEPVDASKDTLGANKPSVLATSNEGGRVHSKPAPDGGWGWMCVLGLAVNFMVYSAIVRSFGITYLQLLDRFHSSPTETAWVGAVNMACTGLFGPVATGLSSRYTGRVVTIAGGLMCFVGVLSTAFAPNIYVCYVTYGLLAGCGSCFTFAPGYMILGDYFEKRTATAMALSAVGSGIGALLAPPLMLFLYNEYGFQGTFIIMGAACLNCCVGGALYRPLETKPKDKRPTKLFEWSLFLRPGYLGYFTLMWGLMLTAALISGYIPALGLEVGLTELEATTLLSMIGIADIIGSLAFGMFLDIPQIRRYRMYWLSFCDLIVALTTVCSPFLTNYAGFVSTVVLRGVFLTHIMSQRATVMGDVIGRRWIPSGIGMLLCANALGAILGRSIGGIMTDAFGSYKAGFYVIGAINGFCALFCATCYACTQKQRRKEDLTAVSAGTKQEDAISCC